MGQCRFIDAINNRAEALGNFFDYMSMDMDVRSCGPTSFVLFHRMLEMGYPFRKLTKHDFILTDALGQRSEVDQGTVSVHFTSVQEFVCLCK